MEIHHGKLQFSKFVATMQGANSNLDAVKLQATTYNQLIAYLFIQGVKSKKSGDLSMVLANSFALGTNQYPQDLPSAASAVATYKAHHSTQDHKSNRHKNPVLTDEEKKDDNPDSDEDPDDRSDQQSEQAQIQTASGFAQPTDLTKVQCYRCQQFGHTSPHCTAPAPVAPADKAEAPPPTPVKVGGNFLCESFPTDTYI